MEISKNINVNNPELLVAIENMQENNTKETVDEMVNQAMKARFITPAKVHAPENVAKTKNGKTIMQQQSQVQFQLIQNENKEQYFPAFTDVDELNKWSGCDKGFTLTVMTFTDYANILADPKCPIQGFVINPFGKSVAFPKGMVMNLMQQAQAKQNGGFYKKQFKQNERLEFKDPEEYPIDLMAAVIGILQERDDVNAAYLKLFKPESDDKQSYLIIVDFNGDMNEIFTAIGNAASPHLNGMQLSMMPYSLEIAKKAVANVEPFYIKED